MMLKWHKVEFEMCLPEDLELDLSFVVFAINESFRRLFNAEGMVVLVDRVQVWRDND